MQIHTYLALILLATAFCGPATGATPLSEAAQRLIAPTGELRFVAYGEQQFAPQRIFRRDDKTYIQLSTEPTQVIQVLEVTSLGYRKIPTSFEAPYLVAAGFAPSMALSIPGQRLIFLEFGSETVKQPNTDSELAIKIRERAQALLNEKTQLDAAKRDLAVRENNVRLAALQQQRDAVARPSQIQPQAPVQTAPQNQLGQPAIPVPQTSPQVAVSPIPAKVFAVFKKDETLQGVLKRWAANEGMELVWSASDIGGSQVAADGQIMAQNLKEAIGKLIGSFKSSGVTLQATFFNNNIVEIAQVKP